MITAILCAIGGAGIVASALFIAEAIRLGRNAAKAHNNRNYYEMGRIETAQARLLKWLCAQTTVAVLCLLIAAVLFA